MKQPDLLILDETATGLDPGEVRNLRTYLSDFAARGGTVLLSTHVLAEVEAVASHVIVIHHQTIAASGALAEFIDPGDQPTASGVRRLEDLFLDMVGDDVSR